MALFKPYRILHSQLNSLPIVEGQLIFVIDTKKIYLDINSQRIPFGEGTIDTDSVVTQDQVGAAGGVAPLNSSGQIDSSYLPGYVDDVIEYAGSSARPATGETGKIYVDTTTNKTYRWGGSSYVEISASLALGETSTSAYRGDRGKTAYDHSQITTGNPHNVTKANVGLGNVENKSSATIRGEITKANVTNALGFTPFEFVVVETW